MMRFMGPTPTVDTLLHLDEELALMRKRAQKGPVGYMGASAHTPPRAQGPSTSVKAHHITGAARLTVAAIGRRRPGLRDTCSGRVV